MNQKRKSSNFGASSDKRQKTSSDTSEIGESKSESPLEKFAGETKESDSDRRGREKKEREQKKTEDKAERERQRVAKIAASNTKPCLANIGGIRVEKNGIIEFEGGTDFGPYLSKQEAEEATGILKKTINNNILKKIKSRGKNGVFENKQVMFIVDAPVDTSNRVFCPVTGCGKHYSTKRVMISHVRAKHPNVFPPFIKINRMPEEYKTFTPPITQKQYAFVSEKVTSNIEGDLKKSKMKKLMALVDGFDEPWGTVNIKGAAKKYHLDEQQILDSIDNNESLTIGGGRHDLQLGLGRTRRIYLAGRTVTFSWKHKVTEEDKDKLTEMNNKETRHKLARQHCVHMNAKGMFAKKNVTDDNGGLIKNGFEFESHGGLFNLSFDRIEDNYTVNGQTFHKLHYPDPENALENINVVAFMANVAYKASTIKIQERYDIYKNKSVEQRQEDLKNVLEISQKATHNKPTPLYSHAQTTWKKDDECKGAFDTAKAYWKHMLVLLKKQKGICAVAKIPMSLESGLWKISGDAINPLLGHVPRNLRLVCLYNNPPDHSKLNKDLTDTTPTSLTTEIHDEYWRIVR